MKIILQPCLVQKHFISTLFDKHRQSVGVFISRMPRDHDFKIMTILLSRRTKSREQLRNCIPSSGTVRGRLYTAVFISHQRS